jgi:hypothetical protein
MADFDARILEIGKRYIAIGIQVSNAYAAEQAKLRLDIVLSRERLCSEDGTLESLAAIEQLSELTRAHKALFEKISTASSSEIAAALSEFPDHEKNKQLSELVATINWHLISQSEFYRAREQWIDAATRICRLIQSCRNTAIFTDTVQFANDDECTEFEQQMLRIEEAHHLEVRLMNEKMARLTKSLGVLGIRPAS